MPGKLRDTTTTVPDAGLYIPDGDIILITHDEARKAVIFRVHQCILAKHSPIFSDMFSIPPPANIDLCDGVPSVVMHDDSKDMRIFLSLLYERFNPPLELISIDVAFSILGTLKLAHKYDVDTVRDRIVCKLRKQWPSSLTEWDALESHIIGIYTIQGENVCLDDFAPEPAAVIRLARECDVPELLPTTFYHLSRISAASEYPTHNTGRYSSLADAQYARSARRSILTRNDLVTLAFGKENMQRWFATMITPALVLHACDGQETRQDCLDCTGYQHTLVELAEVQAQVLRTGDILYALWLWMDNTNRDQRCQRCRKRLVTTLREMREEFFHRLPGFFGL